MSLSRLIPANFFVPSIFIFREILMSLTTASLPTIPAVCKTTEEELNNDASIG